MVQRNRRERRSSNRQPKFAAILLIAVALLSFGIGYIAGRGSAPEPSPAVATTPPRQPIAAPEPPSTAPVVEEKIPEEKLTFFDSLPKGEQPPLGSGINVPPEEKDPVAAKIAQQETAVPQVQAAPVPAVQPRASAPAPKPASVAAAGPAVPHVLQISSFRSPDEAGILMRRLEKKGYQPYIEQADLGSKGVWYRVFLGPYASKEKADAVAARLKSEEKLASLVRKK